MFLNLTFWVINYLALRQTITFIKETPTPVIKNTIDNFFIVNSIFVVSQFIFISYQEKTWNPYIYGSFGMSTGDYIKGIYANSSINMIINSYFIAYYISLKHWKKVILAAFIMLMTTYMSGIVLFFGGIGILLVIGLKISFSRKIIAVFGGIALLFILYFISPENINYALENLSNIFTQSPPRKIISITQTFQNQISGFTEFIFGEGPGRFSSRAAFIAGGEYVSWYPESLVYKSAAFTKNHFSLWNNEVLSIPYNDGTANQPFSIYNQFLGEYGFVGLLLLLFLYLGYFIKRYKYLTYGKLLLITTLGYFILDYWFEYFSVLAIFEMFMLLNLKSNEEKESIETT
ncbi:hypothetical protein H9Q13_10550 [Pontibacter sp. JH31]|uniref:Oligosaccharide repeat unit polymerase n=2 Tax=Pontibacter aquaedesilientis TaxID=2766980 RepID=A0ABR7XH52_9BACT|nr:hypothetical protein [Pontibacter aquaedesilientis]